MKLRLVCSYSKKDFLTVKKEKAKTTLWGLEPGPLHDRQPRRLLQTYGFKVYLTAST